MELYYCKKNEMYIILTIHFVGFKVLVVDSLCG